MATSNTLSITGINISASNSADAFPGSILQGGSITAAAGQFVLVDVSTAAATVMLPAAPHDKSMVTVKLVTSGYASATDRTPNAVTVQCGGSETIDKNGASVQLSTCGQALTLQYDSARRTWLTVGDDMPSSQFDGRFERVVSVKAAPFSAYGDGQHDDTKAIQAAINYATSINAVTFFPSSGESCYRVSQLVLPPGAILEGVSSGSYGANEGTGGVSTLARRDGTNNPLLLIREGNNYSRIRDIQIDGNIQNNTGGDGIHISDSHAEGGEEAQIIIERCYIHHNPGHNIYLGNCRRANKILNSVCTYAGKYRKDGKDVIIAHKDGICVAGSDNTVAHNICGDNARAGINLGTTTALGLDPDPDPDGDKGDSAQGCSAAVTHVIGNDVYKNLVGINVSSGSWGNVISSNGIDRNTKEGVAVYDGHVSATIYANVFHSNGIKADGTYPHIGLASGVKAVHIAANIFGPLDADYTAQASYGVYAYSSSTKVTGDFGILDPTSTSSGKIYGHGA